VPPKLTSFLYTSHFELDPLREVLNLGIMYAEIGSVRWRGNRFRTECELDSKRVRITGELLPAADGPPIGLKVHYAFPGRALDYLVRYGYEPSAKWTFLPTVITNCWITKDRRGARIEMELDQWRILDLQAANNPLEPGAFDAAPFARQSHWTNHIYTNGGFYERGANGGFRLAYTSAISVRPPAVSSQAGRAAFYACWGGLNLAIFALLLRAKEPNTQQNKDQTKEYSI
jgi:hypothetical protein